MAPWRGRLGTPASGRHSGPQGRGGEDHNRRDGSRLCTYPPTDEMAYGQRRNGRNGLESRPPAGTRGSAKPARMTRHQASVSAAAFFAGLGVQTDRSCAFLPVGPNTATPRVTGGSLPSAFTERRHVARTATNGVCHSVVRIPPNAEIPAVKGPPRNGESFPPPAFGGLCRPEAGVPSRPRRRAAASRALPATVSMRNASLAFRPPGGESRHQGAPAPTIGPESDLEPGHPRGQRGGDGTLAAGLVVGASSVASDPAGAGGGHLRSPVARQRPPASIRATIYRRGHRHLPYG